MIYKPTITKGLADLSPIGDYITSDFMRRGHTPYFSFPVDLIKYQTAKAFLIDMEWDHKEDFWLPKSQLRVNPQNSLFFVPFWLCEKNNISPRKLCLVKKN